MDFLESTVCCAVSDEKILKIISSRNENSKEPLLSYPEEHSFIGFNREDSEGCIEFVAREGGRGYVFLLANSDVLDVRDNKVRELDNLYRNKNGVHILSGFYSNESIDNIFYGFYWEKNGRRAEDD